MKNYVHVNSGLHVIIETDEDGAYCARVPDLPGCAAGADTLNEALQDIAFALDTVLDVIREDDPERYRQLVGNHTAQPDDVPETTTTGLPEASYQF